MIFRIVVVSLLTHFYVSIKAAPQIRLVNTGIYQIEELQDFQIMSDLNNALIGKVTIRISTASGTEIAVCESEPIQVLTGLQLYNNVSFRYIGQPQLFSDNSFIVQYQLQEISTGVLVCNNIETVRLLGVQDTSHTNAKKKKHKISKYANISGTIDLQGQYNNRNDTAFYLPINFFRADIRNDIELYNIPLNTRFYITTEQKYSQQNLNIYHIGFDVNRFRQNMTQKAKEKLQKIVAQNDSSKNNALLKLLNPDLYTKNISSYKENLDSKYDHFSNDILGKYQQELGALDTLQQLFKSYDDASMYQLLGELKSMKILTQDSAEIFFNNQLDSLSTQIDSTKRQKLEKLKKFMDKHQISNPKRVMQLVDKVKHFSLQDINKLTQLKQNAQTGMNDLQQKTNLDTKQLLESQNISTFLDKDNMMQKLDEKFGILSKKDKVLQTIKGFDVGYTVPEIGRNTQNGVALNGYNLEFNYKKIIIASNGGKLINNIPLNRDIRDFSFKGLKQFIFSNSIGYGTLRSNYVLLTHTYGTTQLADSLSTQKNHIVALNYQTTVFKRKLSIKGEFPVSLTPKSNGLQYGIAPSIQTNFIISKQIKGQALYEYIHKDYTTFSTPFILKNYHHLDSRLDYVIKEKYTVSSGYQFKQFRDTIGSSMMVRIHTLPISLNARVTKELSVDALFSANWLSQELATEQPAKQFFYTINASLNYHKQFKRVDYYTQTSVVNSFFFNNERVVSENGSIVLNTDVSALYKNLNCNTFHSIRFKKYITTSLSINYIFDNNNLQMNKNFIIFNAQYQHIIGKKFIFMVSNVFNRNLETSFRNSASIQCIYKINRYIMLTTRFQYDKLKGYNESVWRNENGYLLNSGVRIMY